MIFECLGLPKLSPCIKNPMGFEMATCSQGFGFISHLKDITSSRELPVALLGFITDSAES